MKSDAQLVITAPAPYGPILANKTGARLTLGVLTQLISGARSTLIISAPYIQNSFGLPENELQLSLKTALGRGVEISLISTLKSLQQLNISELAQGDFEKLKLFRPAANIENEEFLGSHAKFCVADGERAYIGSANLTKPGMHNNMELGILVDGVVAKQVEKFWKHALETNLYIPISAL